MPIVDIHTHGIDGHGTGNGIGKDILEMARLHGTYGVTDIVPTVYSGSVETMRLHLQAVRYAMETQRNDKTGSSAARILGAGLEGPFLNKAYAGALDGKTFHEPSLKTLETIIDGYEDIIKIITIAPELPDALPLIRAIADLGIKVHMGHTGATFNEAESAFHSGATGITHIFNAMRPFHHREPGIVGFSLTNPHIFVEVIADGYHLHDAALQLVLSRKKIEKTLIISDTVAETKKGHGDRPVTNSEGRLAGGACTVVDAAARLRRQGYDEDLIEGCTGKNQIAYLGSR